MTPTDNDSTIHALQERIKELNCIYGISTLIQDVSLPEEEMFTRILKLVQQAWQYPDITCVRIQFKGITYETDGFIESEWKQSEEIQCKEEECRIEVYYTEEKPEMDEGPFLNEEKRLLKAITDLLASYFDKKLMNEKLNGNKSKKDESEKSDWEVLLDILTKTDPRGSLRITRRMIYHLYRIQSEEINSVLTAICPLDGKDSDWCGINIPNPREDVSHLNNVQKKVFEIAKREMPQEEISNLFHTWLKADKARPLLMSSQKQGIPLNEIITEINRYWDMLDDQRTLLPEDRRAISVALIKRFFTGRLKYINIAKDYITVDDFVELVKGIVGPMDGEGKLGGKSSGLYLAQKIVESEKKRNDNLKSIKFPRSWYLTSDTMVQLVRYNDLDDLVNIKYLDPSEIRQEHPFLEQLLKNATFPSSIVIGIRKILHEIGDKPIIVRSSSLLEDSFEAAFSGKYKSLFLVNTGTEEERLAKLLDAIAEVYASVFAPAPIEYRRERGLLEFTEEMAILIQEVVGTRIGPYYLPAFAGVALSNNEFRWSPRIRREDGIVRLVAGLGTRAVDRISDDYPMLVAPFRPEISVNVMVDETIMYSQHYMDVINLEKGTLETVDCDRMFNDYWDEYPMAKYLVSLHKDGTLRPVQGIRLDNHSDEVVTFSSLIDKTSFIDQVKALLSTLHSKLHTPVDIEFAHDGKDLYLLQCRPQYQALERDRVPVPKDIPNSRSLFTANKYVTNGHIENVDYIVYVDPDAYNDLKERTAMQEIATAVGYLNKKLPKRRFILMGPGRWGSRGDIKLGVPVQYNDINNTILLIEIAKKKGSYQPELSFGTHFFQDLVESEIYYLPLYPDEEGNLLNEKMIGIMPNELGNFAPRFNHLSDVIKVIKVSDIETNSTLSVIMDGEANKALAFIVPPDHWLWRMKKAEEIAANVDKDLYGIQAIYVVGSTKDGTAGPLSDLDLIFHLDGNKEKSEALILWLEGQDNKLCEENRQRTGLEAKCILDVHIITDSDIQNKTSWATHIDNPYNAAKRIDLNQHS